MANPFTVRPWQTDLRGLEGLGNTLGQNRQQAAAQQRTTQAREAVKAAMASGDPSQISQAMVDYPELSDAMDKSMKFKSQATKSNALVGLREILSNPKRAPEVLRDRIEFVAAQGGDPTDTAMELTKYHEDPEGYVNNLRSQFAAIAPKQEFEAHQAVTGQGGRSQFGAQETFKDSEGNLFFGTTRRNPTTGAVEAALAAVGGGPAQPVGKLNMVSSLGLTAPEQITQKAGEAEATRGAELKQDLKHKPAVMRAVKRAEKEAADRGEALSELNRMKAGMPGLEATVGDLKKLAPLATHTLAGRGFNVLARELGFGSTKGSTARAKFISLIDNQVLPLLRETFGAAFTAQEGDRLRKTMADEDSPPEEKITQLDTFIQQKRRNIERAGKMVELSSGSGGQIMIDANGNRAEVFPDGTYKEVP